MSVWIRVRSIAEAAWFGVALCTTLCAQQPLVKFNGNSGVGTKISIVNLRVPGKAWQHFAKARELKRRDRTAESEIELRKAIAIAPRFTSAYLLCASVQVQEHNFGAAISNVTEALRIEPDAMWARVLLASAYNGQKRYEDAAIALEGMRGSEAESWQGSYEHARAAIGIGDVTAALHWSEMAMAKAPESFSDTHLLRANALMLKRRWAESVAQMEVYLQSEGAAVHRVQVLAALQKAKRQLENDDLQKVAWR